MKNGRDLIEQPQTAASSEVDQLNLTTGSVLDLSRLDESTKQELTKKAIEAKIDLHAKGEEASIDINALHAQMGNINQQVAQAAREGNSMTVTHTQSTSIGRTEVVMGNTERAAKGKVSRSAAGEEDKSIKMLIIGGVLAIVVALIVSGG